MLQLLSYLETKPFVISADDDKLEWQQNLYGLGMNRLARSEDSNILVEFQLIDAVTGTIINILKQENIPNMVAECRFQGVESHDVYAYRGKEVKLRIQPWGLAEETKGIVAGVAEVYRSTESGRRKEENEPEKSAFAVATPTSYHLEQNYPNPFNPVTHIQYSLAEAGAVRLRVYDLQGREVALLVNQHQSAGNYKVMFDGRHLVSGVYVYRLEAGPFVASKKLALIR